MAGRRTCSRPFRGWIRLHDDRARPGHGGLGLLFRAGRRPEVAWSGKSLLGGMVMGWGLFNVIEGIIDHQILGIHHVAEYTDNKLPADLAFLAFGAALILLGAVLIRDASLGGERKL